MRLLGTNSSSFGDVDESRGMKVPYGCIPSMYQDTSVLERRRSSWRDLLNIDGNGRLGWPTPQTNGRHCQSSSGVYVRQAVKAHVERLLRPKSSCPRLLRMPPTFENRTPHSYPPTVFEELQAIFDHRSGKGRVDSAERPHRNLKECMCQSPNVPAPPSDHPPKCQHSLASLSPGSCTQRSP